MTPMQPAPFYMSAADWRTAAVKAAAEAPQGSVDFVAMVDLVVPKLKPYGVPPFAFVLAGDELAILCAAAEALGLPKSTPSADPGLRERAVAGAAREATDSAYCKIADDRLQVADDLEGEAYNRPERFAKGKPWRSEADWRRYRPRDKAEWAADLAALEVRDAAARAAREVPAE